MSSKPTIEQYIIIDLNLSLNWEKEVITDYWRMPCQLSTSHMFKVAAMEDVSPQTCLALQGFSKCVLQDHDLTPQNMMDLSGNMFIGFVVEAVLNAMMLALPWTEMICRWKQEIVDDMPCSFPCQLMQMNELDDEDSGSDESWATSDLESFATLHSPPGPPGNEWPTIREESEER